MSITDFLNARIAEDEAVARAAIDPSGTSSSKDGRWLFVEYPYEGSWPVNADSEQSMWADGEWEAHAENWDPARVLAECEARRAIVGLHTEDVFRGHLSNGCKTCGGGAGWPCPTLIPLAAVYADHQDFLDEWRVGA